MVDLANVTANASTVPSIAEPMGLLTMLVGVALLVIAVYIVYKVVRNLVANAVMGGIGLIVLHFLAPMAGLEIEISLLNIVIALVAGLPGLVILVLMAIFGL